MRVTYDPKTNALYIYFRDGAKAATTHRVNDDVLVDLDADGQAIGVEVLSVQRLIDEPDLIRFEKTVSPEEID